jgi:hypothetical protein
MQINRLDLDPPPAQRQIDGLDNPIAGQIEDHARSITPRARRLEHSSWPFLDGCMNTPISAQGHEPLHQRLTTLNCEVPLLYLGASRLGCGLMVAFRKLLPMERLSVPQIPLHMPGAF